MAELFCKNSSQLLAVNFFWPKSLTKNVWLCSKNTSVGCKEKGIKLSRMILHSFKYFYINLLIVQFLQTLNKLCNIKQQKSKDNQRIFMHCYPTSVSHFLTSHKQKVKGISTYKEICRHRGILVNTKQRPVMVTKAQS